MNAAISIGSNVARLRAAPLRITDWRFFVGIASVATVIFMVGIRTAVQAEHDARVLNIAGRQRMLTQKATAELLMSQLDAAPEEAVARGTVRLFEQTLAALMDGGPVFFGGGTVLLPAATSQTFRAALEDVRRSWVELRLASDAWLLGREPGAVAAFTAASRRTLNLMDGAVQVYEREATARATRLRRMQLALVPLWLALLATGLVGERRARDADITKRVNTELQERVTEGTEQLAAANRRLQLFAAMVDSSDDAIVSVDPDRKITSWNPGAERLFGYPALEAMGQPASIIDATELPNDQSVVFGKVGRGERVTDYETRRRRNDGSSVDVSITASPIRDTESRVTGALGIFRDITGRKRADTALHNANARLDAFAQTVSHDLRAPLRSIEGFAKALREDSAALLDPAAQDCVHRIEAAAGRMDTLIEDLLAYAQVTRAPLTLTVVPVVVAVRDALEQMEADLAARCAEVVVEPSVLTVRGHRATLTQVFLNLVANGVKFLEPEKTPIVRLWAERRGDRVRVWVEDNGIGVAPEHQDRIFQPFERLHGMERYPGTGMGLAIVRDAIERLGGRVGVESQIGTGSRFWVELPAGEPQV